MNQPATEFSTIAAARANYPALERWTYMDLAGRGVLSRGVRAAVDAQLDERMMNGGDKVKFFEMIERVRGKFAQLINADRKSTRLNSSHSQQSRMPSSA